MKENDIFAGKYRLLSLIGSGSFGDVWVAEFMGAGVKVALKIYNQMDKEGVEEFKDEFSRSFALNHSNLANMKEFVVDENRPALVMPLYSNGSAKKLVGNCPETMAWQFIHDVASGLAYLHSSAIGLVHQDIKPENILINENNRFVISDFGISKHARASMSHRSSRNAMAGTRAYMGLERFGTQPITVFASDIWSLGATIYELLQGYAPFGEWGGGYQKTSKLPPIQGPYSNELKQAIYDMLAINTWDRPTAQQLAEYAYGFLHKLYPMPQWTSHNTDIEGEGPSQSQQRPEPVSNAGSNSGSNPGSHSGHQSDPVHVDESQSPLPSVVRKPSGGTDALGVVLWVCTGIAVVAVFAVAAFLF